MCGFDNKDIFQKSSLITEYNYEKYILYHENDELIYFLHL